jgi:hypothetical protein
MARDTVCEKSVAHTPTPETSTLRTLIIGDVDRWAAAGRFTVSHDCFEFCQPKALNVDVLQSFQPEMVLSPLFGDDFDVIDIAATLRRLGYRGRYRAIAPYIPNTSIIVAEVACVAPAIDFDILVMPEEAA